MKFVAKVILIILSIPISILCILSINIRFQFLSFGFWANSFERGNVYSQISKSLEDRLVAKVVAEGGRKSDIGVLSNLISSSGLKNFFEENAMGVLDYANGQSSEITVFAPNLMESSKEGFDIGDLGSLSQKMRLSDFLKEYNVAGLSESDILIISKFGIWSWMLLGVSFTLLILVLALIYLLTNGGKYLKAQGVALTLSGSLILIVYFAGTFLSKLLTERFVGSSNVGASLIAIAAPPIIKNVLQIWIWFGVSAVFLGILLFFIRKPVYNYKK